MTIVLYHCKDTRSLRPLWTLEELGLDYQLVSLPFPPRKHARQFRAINALGTVPFLVEGEVRLTESVAICQYLVHRHAAQSSLYVRADEPDFASFLNWLSYSEATMSFPLSIVFRYGHLEPTERRIPQAVEDYMAFFLGRLRLLREALATRSYLCADRFTIADICVSYALLQARQLAIAEAFDPPLGDYWECVSSRPSYRRCSEL